MWRILLSKKSNVPTLGPRLSVKFPRVEIAKVIKCPTYARGPPPLSSITLKIAKIFSQIYGNSHYDPMTVFLD